MIDSRTALIGAALGALIWVAALWVASVALPTAPLGVIDVEASGQHADRIDSVLVILDHPQHPATARVIAWIDGVPSECIAGDRGERGWREVDPSGTEYAPAAPGRFLSDPECIIRVRISGGEVDPERVEIRFAGVTP